MSRFKYHPNLDEDIKRFEDTCKSYLEYTLSVGKTPNLALLCIPLGIDLSTLNKMAKWNNYSNAIEKVKTAIQGYMIDKSLENKINTTMSIFILKNHYGYAEKHDHNIQQQLSIDTNKLSTEELENKLKEYEHIEMKLKAKLVDPKMVEEVFNE